MPYNMYYTLQPAEIFRWWSEQSLGTFGSKLMLWSTHFLRSQAVQTAFSFDPIQRWRFWAEMFECSLQISLFGKFEESSFFQHFIGKMIGPWMAGWETWWKILKSRFVHGTFFQEVALGWSKLCFQYCVDQQPPAEFPFLRKSGLSQNYVYSKFTG